MATFPWQFLRDNDTPSSRWGCLDQPDRNVVKPGCHKPTMTGDALGDGDCDSHISHSFVILTWWWCVIVIFPLGYIPLAIGDGDGDCYIPHSSTQWCSPILKCANVNLAISSTGPSPCTNRLHPPISSVKRVTVYLYICISAYTCIILYHN